MPSAAPADRVLGTRHSPAPLLPGNACDTHVHVFGPAHRYPYAPDRSYIPPDALPSDLSALHRHLGITRTVLVQPSPYGTDNARLLDGLRELGESARGVAVIAPDADPGELRDMHEAGVRGVRVNLGVHTANDLEQARERIQATARKVAPLGWHLDLNIDATALAAFHEILPGLPVPVVLDHFAGIKPTAATCAEALTRTRTLLETGRVWVKLSAPYRVTDSGSYADLDAVVTALLGTRADRALWGSDWPHTGGTPADRDPHRIQPYLTIDDGQSLTRFSRQLGASLLRQVLVDNPAMLYGL
ncbi:amidohydrolase family protein [Streptomyces viridochromogenes]|uniref:Putative Amidohydrolase 2 n=1 Tax=Streptomyces viridochromogenes Tue57 TaxID=1160705 RepID=L8P7A6_STRVR|nr:amidohydrolase family protein [Streptomyces viridochromogenes]ELS51137.1 putative Amidohydrolase 2 [Streptomyces viridochromogenes Tue57]